jgi:hypothetical protein
MINLRGFLTQYGLSHHLLKSNLVSYPLLRNFEGSEVSSEILSHRLLVKPKDDSISILDLRAFHLRALSKG